MVWISCSGLAGSPLIEMAASPTPKAVSMLNWPASKLNGSSISMVRVKTSERSRTRFFTRPMRGTMGSACGSTAGRSVVSAIDIDDLQSCGLQALEEDRHEAFHQLVAETVVVFAF